MSRGDALPPTPAPPDLDADRRWADLGEQGLGGALSDPREGEGGLEAARTRGRKGGRKLGMEEKLALASAMLTNREIPVGEVCEAVVVSRSTLYRHLEPEGSMT